MKAKMMRIAILLSMCLFSAASGFAFDIILPSRTHQHWQSNIYDDVSCALLTRENLAGSIASYTGLYGISGELLYDPDLLACPRVEIEPYDKLWFPNRLTTGYQISPGHFLFTFYEDPFADLAPHHTEVDVLATVMFRVNTKLGVETEASFRNVQACDANGHLYSDITLHPIRFDLNNTGAQRWSLYE